MTRDDISRLQEEAASLRDQNTELDRRLAEMEQRREWVGLTEQDFSAINQSSLTKLQAATCAESILKEKNGQ
jgi:cell division septum initiation protein DivIVA